MLKRGLWIRTIHEARRSVWTKALARSLRGTERGCATEALVRSHSPVADRASLAWACARRHSAILSSTVKNHIFPISVCPYT